MQGALTDEPLFVFGYGSLVWRPGVEHVDSRVACLHSFVRRFHQGSTDHRGTPSFPGRVVTLVPQAGGRTWGVALRLPPPGPRRIAALACLEEREKQYDVRLRAHLFDSPAHDARVCVHNALLYVASPDTAKNVNYVGETSFDITTDVIARAVGPSGHNCEYVYQLAAAIRALGPEAADEALFELERAVRRRRAALGLECCAPAEEEAVPSESVVTEAAC